MSCTPRSTGSLLVRRCRVDSRGPEAAILEGTGIFTASATIHETPSERCKLSHPQLNTSISVDEETEYARFRLIVVRSMIVIVAAFSGLFFVFLARALWVEDLWLMTILQGHFAGLVAVPLAAMGSLCVVVILRSTDGPIEFEGLGFKFRGASGPVVLWALCFMVMVSGIRLLW
jgi:hypothetical protein